jgi:hypothetical protein
MRPHVERALLPAAFDLDVDFGFDLALDLILLNLALSCEAV